MDYVRFDPRATPTLRSLADCAAHMHEWGQRLIAMAISSLFLPKPNTLDLSRLITDEYHFPCFFLVADIYHDH